VLVVLATLLVVAGVVTAAGWWAVSTNQLGHQIERLWAKRGLPGRLMVGAVTLESRDRVVLRDVAMAENETTLPALAIPRLVVEGRLWRGEVATIRIQGTHLRLDAKSIRYLAHVIDKESDIPPDGPPTTRHFIIDGVASVDGERFLQDAVIEMDITGPAATGTGRGLIDGKPFALRFVAEGQGDTLHHTFSLPSAEAGTSSLSVHQLCRRLAAMDLLPAIPAGALPWVPDRVDLAGTTVIADRHWRLFTGNPMVTWPAGVIHTGLTLDRSHLHLEHLRLDAAIGLGVLDGALKVDFQSQTVQLDALSWHPGPNVPLPASIPTDAILAAMPQAIFIARHQPDWDLALDLVGTGAQAHLTWRPGAPLTIDGGNIPLSLLQPFLPAGLDLAAGRAGRLSVRVSNQLEHLHAEVEQTRVLWNGWALGPVEATVDAHPADNGLDLTVDLMNLQAERSRRLGLIGWRGGNGRGDLTLRIDDLEVLMTRLKGPQALPELRGGLDAVLALTVGGPAVRGRIVNASLRNAALSTTAAQTAREMVRNLDATLTGTFVMQDGRFDASLSGRLAKGQVRIADRAIDIALRQPIFTASIGTAPGTITVHRLLLRAADDRAQPVPDGFSAGIDAELTTTPLAGTVTGTIDHADLGWVAGMIPPVERRLRGEGAVTFTAKLGNAGLERLEGWFLPLGATLDLGGGIRATGLSGAVQFLLAQPGK
jgi:hypothetical protein